MINYQNLHDSISHYESSGFVRIESPWTVSKDIADITRPKGKIEYELTHNQKVLVGSGEQSFLYLYLKGFLPKGKFQTITPCFRDDLFDKLHTKYFMKNELIITDNVDENALTKMIHCAKTFFEFKLGEENIQLEAQATPKKIDLIWDISFVLNDPYLKIELGSYGIRSCDYLTWIFGTGCAEPRLSYCQNLCQNLLERK